MVMPIVHACTHNPNERTHGDIIRMRILEKLNWQIIEFTKSKLQTNPPQIYWWI